MQQFLDLGIMKDHMEESLTQKRQQINQQSRNSILKSYSSRLGRTTTNLRDDEMYNTALEEMTAIIYYGPYDVGRMSSKLQSISMPEETGGLHTSVALPVIPTCAASGSLSGANDASAAEPPSMYGIPKKFM